jgi:hypothetical protein
VVEDHLVQYIKTRRQLFTQDKLGLSWLVLKDTAMKYASMYLTNETDKQDFSASSGWLNDVLKRNELIGVKLHGEAAEKSAEEIAQAQVELNARIDDICAKHSITRDRIYNADQTGLYYQKLPNRIYADDLEINILESILTRKIVVFTLEGDDNNSFNLSKYDHYREEIDYSTALCVLFHDQVKEHYSLLMQIL